MQLDPHFLARAQRRVDRLPPGIKKPALRVVAADWPVDLDFDGMPDIALTVPGLHGPHTIVPGAWSLYLRRPSCTMFVGEVDGTFAISAQRHGGLADLESTVNGDCSSRMFGVDQYRWQFDGAQYRIASHRECQCPTTDRCGPWN